MELRSEFSVEIGIRKLGQGRNKSSHVGTLNSELGTHTLKLGTRI